MTHEEQSLHNVLQNASGKMGYEMRYESNLISMEGVKLVKAFVRGIRLQKPEFAFPQKGYAHWSLGLWSTRPTPNEMLMIGIWYAKHHKAPPTWVYVYSAIFHIRKNGQLPDHALKGNTESLYFRHLEFELSIGGTAEQLDLEYILHKVIPPSRYSTIEHDPLAPLPWATPSKSSVDRSNH